MTRDYTRFLRRCPRLVALFVSQCVIYTIKYLLLLLRLYLSWAEVRKALSIARTFEHCSVHTLIATWINYILDRMDIALCVRSVHHRLF